jgi:hypothetical protein
VIVRVMPFFIRASPNSHRKTACFQRMGKGHLEDRFKESGPKILMELDCAIHVHGTKNVLIHLRVSVPP